MAENRQPTDENPSCSPAANGRARGRLIARQVAGWGLMLLGVVGIMLPVLPGWIFLAWGAVILAPDVPFIGRLLDRLAERVPSLRSAIARVRRRNENRPG